MKNSRNFDEWKTYAEEFDNLKDIKAWKENIYSKDYDYEYIIMLRDEFKEAREKCDHILLIHLIRTHAVRGIGGISSPKLYKTCFTGTKNLIEDYHEEFIKSLEYISLLPPEKFPFTQKLEFFAETRHAFGRSALLLSGGAGLGLYHFGILKILFEERVIPRIITGSSIGSIIASAVCTTKMEDLDKIFKPGYLKFDAFAKNSNEQSIFKKILRLFTDGYLMDSSVVAKFIRDNIGDVTFQEAYDKTGWILNITVTGSGNHDGYRVLNYLTAPNVLIWSASVASCSIPLYFQPVELYCKNAHNEIVPYVTGGRKFIDGSVAADLPRERISEFFNVNNFLVSQTNPWVIPFLNRSDSVRHSRKKFFLRIFEMIKDFVLSEFAHRAYQLSRIGLLPLSLTKHLNIIYQNYTGDITIWPIPKMMDYLNLISYIFNPNDELIQKFNMIGEKRVYPKIAEIRSTVKIEKAMEVFYNNIKGSRYQLKKKGDDYLSPSVQSESESGSNFSSPGKLPKRTKPENIGRQSGFSVPRNSIFDDDPKLHKFFSQKSGEPPEEIKEEAENKN